MNFKREDKTIAGTGIAAKSLQRYHAIRWNGTL
jgi:hypothetical protein